MFEVENVFRGVESKLQINEDVSIYIGQPREEFFYQYVCDYDSDFYEPLSVRVNLVAFAEKIVGYRPCLSLFQAVMWQELWLRIFMMLRVEKVLLR